MLISSPAIVLNRITLNDTTLIVNLYTRQMGSVAFAIKRAKTSKAGIQSALLQPLSSISVEWEHKNTKRLQHMSSISVLQPYTSIPYHPQKNIMASFLSEILYHSTKQEHQGDLYDLITDSLRWLDNASGHFSNFNITFLIRLICQLGFHPNTDNPSSYPFFDLQNAEFTPKRPSHNYYLGPNDAQYIPLFMSLNYSNMHLLKTTHQQRFRALKIITTYYKLHITGFPDVKSLDIVNELLKPKTAIRS